MSIKSLVYFGYLRQCPVSHMLVSLGNNTNANAKRCNKRVVKVLNGNENCKLILEDMEIFLDVWSSSRLRLRSRLRSRLLFCMF